MSKPKITPTDEQIWAAVFATHFEAQAREHAYNRGHGWSEWIGGETELAAGAAEDAATLADWAVAALKKARKEK